MNGIVRLSQCMIVKNEEKNIEKALGWGKGIVDEQIVVDTGSTDKTVEIAQRMGARVLHFEWNDDFSAAKNYAIEQASGNWIAFLDADEYFMPQDAKKLKGLLKTIENSRYQGGKPHFVRSMLVNLKDDGTPSSTSVQDRIFQNVSYIRYHNRVHEVLDIEEGRKFICYDAKDSLTIYHTGYSNSAFAERGKLLRNLELLEKELLENPDNYDAKAYMGDVHLAAGRYQEALNCFIDVVENGHKNPDTMVFTFDNAYGQLMQILCNSMDIDRDFLDLWYEKAISKVPVQPDIDYWYGFYLFNHEQWEDSFFYLEQALKKLEAYQGTKTMHISGDLEGVYCMLARSAQELSDDVNTVKYGMLALRINPFLDHVLIVLFNLFQEEKQEQQTAAGTIGLLKKLYRTNVFRDKLFIFKCAKISGFTKVEEWVKELFTEAEKAEINEKNIENPERAVSNEFQETGQKVKEIMKQLISDEKYAEALEVANRLSELLPEDLEVVKYKLFLRKMI